VSHHIYQTEGIVLGSFNVGESNRFLYIFTKDLGLLGASAQGVRELKSKLQFSLQDFSYSMVDLVRGKEVWRVTNAGEIHNLKSLIKNDGKKKALVNITSLLKRLCIGEGVHEGMFEDVSSGFLFLKKESFTTEELRFFEIILVLKILNYLGYWGDDERFSIFLKNKEWNKKILGDMSSLYSVALCEVNSAIKESHL